MITKCYGESLVIGRVALVVLTAWGPGVARGAVQQAPKGAEAGQSPEMQAAKALYAAGLYADAARSFEAVWRQQGWVGALYNAGMAWEAAGEHDARAIAAWRGYLAAAGEVSQEERGDLERRIGGALARTGTLRIRYEGAPWGRPTRLILRREGVGDGSAVELEFPPAGATEVPVDRGAWQVVGWREGAEVVATARVAASGTTLDVTLEGPEEAPEPLVALGPAEGPAEEPTEEPTEEPEGARLRRLRLSLGVGLGAAGAALVVSGAVIWPYGAQGSYEAWIGGEAGRARQVGAEYGRQLVSVSLLGGGVGAWVGAATAAGGALAPRKVAVQAALGGGFVLGGALLQWAGATCIREAQVLENFAGCRARDFTGGALLGLGGGVIGASLVTLVAGAARWPEPRRRASRKTGVSVQLGSTGAGVSVGGIF